MNVTNNSNVTDLDSLGVGIRTKPQKEHGKLDQGAFWKLLMAQMKNLNPLDTDSKGTEFIAQMAQFSAVDGIQYMQKSMDSLASSLQSQQALQATSLVGRSVLVESPEVRFDGTQLKGAVPLSQSTNQLSIEIKNGQGELVKYMNLGPQHAGTIGFAWDGTTDDGEKANPGFYQVKATVNGLGREASGVTTYLAANVQSVSLPSSQNEMTLNLAGIGEVPFSRIREVNQ